MTLGRSGLLALALAAGMTAGASMAAADGPPGRDAGWPNAPWASWQGLYGGVHVGSIDAWWDDGFVGGVQLGRNWQSGAMVYGIEGDLSLSGADSIDWVGTVRGRLGYLLSQGILLYGTAGLGLVDFDGGGAEAEFVYGLGIEGKLTQATTLRLEYLAFDDTEVEVVRVGVNWKLGW
ncbi:MAG: outer membrane beta-barrel protein [Hyphomicrobiaceae bacterium]